jgi:hypothetical protein
MKHALTVVAAALALAQPQAAAAQTAGGGTRATAPFLTARPFIIAVLPQWAQWPQPGRQAPPPPLSPPEPVQGRLPTSPNYQTTTEAQRQQQHNNAVWARWAEGMAEWMERMPVPTTDEEARRTFEVVTAYANTLAAPHLSGQRGTPQYEAAVGRYITNYYAWRTRAFGDPYGGPGLTVSQASMQEGRRRWEEYWRLNAAWTQQRAQDARWQAMVDDRFNNSAWNAFAQNGTLSTLQLEAIYAQYDPSRTIPPARSLSSAGTSLSSAGNSLSSAGNSLSSLGNSLSLAGLDYRDPAVASLNEVLYGVGRYRHNAFSNPDDIDPARAAQMAYNAGSFDVRFNRSGREHLESGGYLAASLFSQEDDYLRFLTANGLTGLDALLAQPFNVILTWGQNAYDLDLHMTGPLGEGVNERFHIYYLAEGDLEAQPFAKLITDCVCNAGSEVILTSALNRGGVYRVSAFNFGDQSATSTNLANQSQAQIQIVRGGTTQSVGNGTTIIGGRTILTVDVPVGQPGNTWVAAELDPRNGRITVPGTITQSPGSGGVQ